MHIKPKPNITVRDPLTMRVVPPDGITVSEHDLFWHRLLMDGDFEVVDTENKLQEGDDHAN